MRPAQRRLYARTPRLGGGYFRHRLPGGAASNFHVWEPTGYTAGTACPLIILTHGAGSGAVDTTAYLRGPDDNGVMAALNAAGYLAISCVAPGTISLADNTRTWNNPSSVDDYVDAYNYVAARYKITRTLVMGASMGGLAALTLIGSGRIPNVRGCQLMYPVCSLDYMYQSTGYAPEITTAWGGAYNTTIANGFDPCRRLAADFAKCPKYRITHSASDTVVSKTNNTDAFNTLASGVTTITVVSTSGDHGDASNWSGSAVTSFFDSCT